MSGLNLGSIQDVDINPWIEFYRSLGWALVPIPARSKGPDFQGWNLKEKAYTNGRLWPQEYRSCGLAHAWAGTCAIDLDQLKASIVWFGERDIDLQAILDHPAAARIISGKPDSGKLIFRLPRPLESIIVKDSSGAVIFELRCASRDGLTVQDVLPPSIHPSGQRYRWANTDALNDLPLIPEPILEVWQSLIDKRTEDESRRATAASEVLPAPDRELVQAALEAIDPDIDRDAWLHVAMALHSMGEEWGYEAFDTWSANGTKYGGQADTSRVWRSLRHRGAGGVSIGTLFHIAREAGWTPLFSTVTAEEAFGGIDGPQMPGEVAADAQVAIDPMDSWHDAVSRLDPGRVDVGLVRKLISDSSLLDSINRAIVIQAIKKRLRSVLKVTTIDDLVREIDAQNEDSDASLIESALGQQMGALEQRYVYVANIAKHMDLHTNCLLTSGALSDKHRDLDSSIAQVALNNPEDTNYRTGGGFAPVAMLLLRQNRELKVDRVDLNPGEPRIYSEMGSRVLNMWDHSKLQAGEAGDPTPWYRHCTRNMGFSEAETRHLVQWMAFTVRFPHVKINHAAIIGGSQGTGKDWLLYPLHYCLGQYARTIMTSELLSNFNEYLVGSKLLQINELEASNHRDGEKANNVLKAISAAPPDRLSINSKGVSRFEVRNLMSVCGTTNDPAPLKVDANSRRLFMLWSDLNIMDGHGLMLPHWVDYWQKAWNWMQSRGAAVMTFHLLNEVDLSDFHPGIAPQVSTAFLKSVTEYSKDPVQLMIEDMIEEGNELFSRGAFTIDSLWGEVSFSANWSQYDLGKCPSKTRLGKAMGAVSGWRKIERSTRVNGEPRKARFWTNIHDIETWEAAGIRRILRLDSENGR